MGLDHPGPSDAHCAVGLAGGDAELGSRWEWDADRSVCYTRLVDVGIVEDGRSEGWVVHGVVDGCMRKIVHRKGGVITEEENALAAIV